MMTLEWLYQEKIADEYADVNAIADQMGISRNTLYEKTVRETGKTPKEYLEALRLRSALPYLQAGKSLAFICGKVGYAHTKTFISAFKRNYGITPGEWAKQNAPPQNCAKIKTKKKMSPLQNDITKRHYKTGIAKGCGNIVILRKDFRLLSFIILR